MTRRDILIFLFKWKRSIFFTFIFIVSVVALLVFAMPPTFLGKATVLVERNRSPIMRTNFSPGLDMIEVLNTESRIIISRTVMTAVVDKLKPHERPSKATSLSLMVDSLRKKMQNWGLSMFIERREKCIERLLKHVKVVPVINSNILDIKYYDEDPEWAAKTVNEIVSSYIRHHLSVYSTHGSAELYLSQMKVVKNNLISKRKKLIAYKRKISVIGESRDELTHLVRKFSEQILISRNQLSELLSRFEPGHKDVLSVKSSIVKFLESEKKAQAQIHKLDLSEPQIKKMELAIISDGQTYEGYKKKYDNARISELANIDLINIRVVDYSPVSTHPDHSRLFYIAISAAAGFVFAFVMAFIREYFDRRVTTPDVAERLLCMPELGSIGNFSLISYPWKWEGRFSRSEGTNNTNKPS